MCYIFISHFLSIIYLCSNAPLTHPSHPHTPHRELFNAAFVSCWMELRPVHQEDFVSNLKQALTLQNIPEITQTVLNLAEFMEHCEEATVRIIQCTCTLYCVWKCTLQC